jgi:hypothetical protein
MPVLSTIPAAVERMTSKLRFPQLFLLVGGLFLLDLLIPDMIPFADEILLGLLTVLLGSLQRREPTEAPREVKDVTPPTGAP